MEIRYDEELKELPNEQLRGLFIAVGWSDGKEEGFMRERFNAPFINSTLVVSAWDGDRLVGAVRVLSDKITRSVVYDLLVEPSYQRMGIGKELLSRCRAKFPMSEWLIQTKTHIAPYYEKLGYKRVGEDDVFLNVECEYFKGR